MASQEATIEAREPYEAPAIEDVPVRPEEIVLSGCKTPVNLTGMGVNNGCSLGSCVSVGGS